MKNAPAIVVLTIKYYPISNMLLGLGIYLTGFLLSYVYGAVSYFLQTWLFALACVGIVWVSSMWTWAFRSLEGLLTELKSSFAISESDFIQSKRDFLRHIASDRIGFLSSLPGYAFVIYHIWYLTKGGITLPAEVPVSIQGNLVFISYVVIVFSFCVYFVFATTHIFLQSLIFLKKLTKSHARINLLQIRRKIKLDKTNNAILTATLGWFVGVSLVMTLIFAYTSVVIISFLIFVVVVGLLFFFIPQILFHNSICRAKEGLLEKIVTDFDSKLNLPVSPDCDSQKALLLCMLFDQVDKISEWPFNVGLVFQVSASAIIPVATALVGLAGK